MNNKINLLDHHLSNFVKSKEFQAIVKYLIENSESILDIGCGIGDYLKYTRAGQRVVAVEPHPPYIEKAKEVAPWVDFKNTDGINFFETTNENFDLILMIDVVEHLEEEDGFKLISEAVKRCNNVVFAQIPIGNHEQEEDAWNLGGEYWQTHRTIWDESKLKSTDFNFIEIWKKWYDWKENINKSKDTSIAFHFKNPVVSVVVPSYNQAEWLPKTLDSILEQSYPFWEAIIVDDGSTDNTWDVIEEYIQKDKRFRGIHKENGGISSALNKGIENAKGEYFCWLSSDDLFYPEKLWLQIEAYDKLDESYGLVFGQFDFVDADDNVKDFENSKPFEDGLEFPQQLKYDIVDGCTIMIPLKVMRELNGFNYQFKHAQDTEFWFRLAAKGYKFHYIEQKLVKRRIHEEQGFTDFRLDCRYDGYDIVDFYLNRYSFADFYKNIEWTNDDDLIKFMQHLFDMLQDPECHINHPVLKEKYWEWLIKGINSLNPSIRHTILKSGVAFFAEQKSEHYKEYLKKFESVLNIKTYLKTDFKIENEFHDLYKFDRSTSDYPFRLFEFGEKCEEKWKYSEAISVYKYLSDYPNPLYEKSFEKFKELAFAFQEFKIFINSFKRKKSVLEFDDKTKLLYVWAKLSLGNNAGVEQIINAISDKKLSEFARKWLAGNYEETKDSNILIWNYSVINYQFEHYFKIRCDKCGTVLNKRIKFELTGKTTTRAYLCTSCYTPYKITDGQMKPHFMKRIRPVSEFPAVVNRAPKVAFVMRYSNIIGGGVKVAFKHIEKLAALGCEITVYSDAPPPDWTTLPCKFIRLNDHYEITDLNADAVVIFSVYDAPKILMKFSPNRVFHLCQGYEGYHLGRNYDELRSDKFFYETLHSLPVQNIVVSKHLVELFKSKFGRTSHYIPNSIDFNVFYPMPEIHREENSILFIGNPYDPLKGFLFLVETLALLFDRHTGIKKLRVYVLWGGQGRKDEVSNIQYPQLEIEFINGLTSEQVAELLNRVSLLVSCSMYEGFGLPVLEAMACGTPAITTANMGVESFCVDGKNALIVNYGDKENFAEKIADIISRRIDTAEIIENGFDTALEYSGDKCIRYFIDEYSKILNYNFPEEKKEKLTSKYSIDENKLREMLHKKLSLLNLAPLNEDYLTLALKHLENNNLFEALTAVRKAIDNYEAKNSKLSLNELYEIEKSIEAAIKNTPSRIKEEKSNKANNEPLSGNETLDTEGVIIRAENLIQSENYSEAESLLTDILRMYPSNVDALNNLAVIKILSNEYETALNMLERVLELSPENETAIDNLAYLSSVLENYSKG